MTVAGELFWFLTSLSVRYHTLFPPLYLETGSPCLRRDSQGYRDNESSGDVSFFFLC